MLYSSGYFSNLKRIRITSYINNLDYEIHKDLYSVIAKIVSKTVPLWNRTMVPFEAPCYPIAGRYPEIRDYYEHNEYKNTIQAWRERCQTPWKPNPKIFEPLSKYFKFHKELFYHPEARDLWEEFGKLQIIIKFTNIYLTPDQPTYDGEPWQIAGQLNENMQVGSSDQEKSMLIISQMFYGFVLLCHRKYIRGIALISTALEMLQHQSTTIQ